METGAATGRDPRRGYALAVLTMAISGVSIYVNSLGVRLFSDSTLYTALKNAIVGIALACPLVFSARVRRAYRRLSRPQWLLLLAVALIGGSLPYALYFRGLQLSTPVTASLIDHTQFLLVALLAALFLKERFRATLWAALVVLLIGLSLGLGVRAVRWDAGVPFLLAGTILFAVDFVVMKHLLGSVEPLTVMTFKMTLGSVLLFTFVAATGHAGMVPRLSALQLAFAGVTGLILLAFTVSSVLGLRHASATAVTAIPAGSPIVTTALVLLSQQTSIPAWRLLGLLLALLAVLAIFLLGRYQELRAVSDGGGTR